ncbi:hypothetical protein D9M68_836600 [compost metagenome]
MAGKGIHHIGEQAKGQTLEEGDGQDDAGRVQRQVQADKVNGVHSIGHPDHPSDHYLRQREPKERERAHPAQPQGRMQHLEDAQGQSDDHQARGRQRAQVLAVQRVIQPKAHQHQDERYDGPGLAVGEPELAEFLVVRRQGGRIHRRHSLKTLQARGTRQRY